MQKSFFKKVIVAINGREPSIQAAKYAIMMAKSYSITLKFIFVVDEATIKYLTMNKLLVTSEKNSFLDRITSDGNNYLNYVQALAASKGVKALVELKRGGVFKEILMAAEEFDADLIVLGGSEVENAKSGLKRNMLRTEQGQILAYSKCPVMFVQDSQIDAKFKIFK
jgi:nucleotide-binding universal stress UspA family protein